MGFSAVDFFLINLNRLFCACKKCKRMTKILLLCKLNYLIVLLTFCLWIMNYKILQGCQHLLQNL